MNCRQIPVVLALALLVGCSSSYPVLTSGQPFDVSGKYRSTEAISELGTITMQIQMARPTRTFKAWLVWTDLPDAESEGVGTVGDDHLILNFDRGLKSDFYFEGTFETAGESVSSISGNFIFPDRENHLQVDFEPVGQ